MPSTYYSILSGRLPASVAYPLALLLAAGMVLYLYPSGFLAGQGAYFVTGDAASHISGWLFFREDQWRFPLLHSVRLNAPEGVSIAFTDSIPLVALLLKPFRSLLPDGFHYFGLWHAFCYLLQAVTAVFLVRSLGARHLPALLLATGFALTWPALTHRFGHTALMTHGVLLMALALYFRGFSNDPGNRTRTCAALTALACIALLIHPYLLAMTYPIHTAYLARLYVLGQIDLRRGLICVALSLLPLMGLMYAGGYLLSSNVAAPGFGRYSMNLKAPLCGGMLCEFTDATGGQHEGYNYFGAGGLLLLGFALATCGRELLRLGRRHFPLLLVLLGFCLFAVSNRIHFGHYRVLEIPLPGSLEDALGVFRASGRFFWPVGYTLLFASLAVLLRKQSGLFLTVATAALVLQWLDTRGPRELVQYQASAPADLDLARWQSALAGFEAIDVYPAFGCGHTPLEDYVRYQYIAANLGLTISSGYTARPSGDCDSKNDFVRAPAQDDHLYVKTGFQRNPLDLPPLFRELAEADGCVIDLGHLVCARSQSASLMTVGTPFVPPEQVTARWAASELPSVIGRLQDSRLVPLQQGAIGYLSFGPYVNISPGTYEYGIEYRSEDRLGIAVGNWDLIGRKASGDLITVAEGSITGTQGHPSRLARTSTIHEPLSEVELRLFSNGGDIKLEAITLSRQSEEQNNDN